jgi:hypothetical protein
VTRGEVHPLVDYAILIRRCGVGGEFQPVRANRVTGNAQLDGFARIERADHDRRLTEKVHGPDIWCSEEDDRGDALSHIGL